MAVHKVERQMNLVICLLSTRRYLGVSLIRDKVHGYGDCASDEAFRRMFDRDKKELRELGVPLETGRDSYAGEEGYRIRPESYALPPISLSPAEAAAIGLAGTLLDAPQLAATTRAALLKLAAAGVGVDGGETLPPVSTHPGDAAVLGPTLSAILHAIDERRAVRFSHRSTLSEPLATREVEPWGVVTRRGHWYLVGHDRDRDEIRTFRLSRISDVHALAPAGAVDVPVGTNVGALVDSALAGFLPGVDAGVWVESGRAHDLRRQAASVTPTVRHGVPGDLLELRGIPRDRLLSTVTGLGRHAHVIRPPDLAAAVRERLLAVVAATEDAS